MGGVSHTPPCSFSPMGLGAEKSTPKPEGKELEVSCPDSFTRLFPANSWKEKASRREGAVIPFAIKNLLNVERDILAAPSAGGGPTKSHPLAFRNPLH